MYAFAPNAADSNGVSLLKFCTGATHLTAVVHFKFPESSWWSSDQPGNIREQPWASLILFSLMKSAYRTRMESGKQSSHDEESRDDQWENGNVLSNNVYNIQKKPFYTIALMNSLFWLGRRRWLIAYDSSSDCSSICETNHRFIWMHLFKHDIVSVVNDRQWKEFSREDFALRHFWVACQAALFCL